MLLSQLTVQSLVGVSTPPAFLTAPAFVVLGPFGWAFSLMSRDQCCVSEGRLQNGGTAATQRRVFFLTTRLLLSTFSKPATGELEFQA